MHLEGSVHVVTWDSWNLPWIYFYMIVTRNSWNLHWIYFYIIVTWDSWNLPQIYFYELLEIVEIYLGFTSMIVTWESWNLPRIYFYMIVTWDSWNLPWIYFYMIVIFVLEIHSWNLPRMYFYTIVTRDSWNLPWIYFYMIVTWDSWYLNLFVGRCCKCMLFYSKLFHTSSIHLSQEAHNPCLLSRSWRSIHQQMREISSLNLYHVHKH